MKLKGKKLLIFDDILTTGSTISEITKVMRSLGAEDITAFTTSCSDYNLRFAWYFKKANFILFAKNCIGLIFVWK